MRDIETIDSELRLVAALRRAARELVWSRDERADVDEVVDAIGMPVSGLGDGDTAE